MRADMNGYRVIVKEFMKSSDSEIMLISFI